MGVSPRLRFSQSSPHWLRRFFHARPVTGKKYHCPRRLSSQSVRSCRTAFQKRKPGKTGSMAGNLLALSGSGGNVFCQGIFGFQSSGAPQKEALTIRRKKPVLTGQFLRNTGNSQKFSSFFVFSKSSVRYSMYFRAFSSTNWMLSMTDCCLTCSSSAMSLVLMPDLYFR